MCEKTVTDAQSLLGRTLLGRESAIESLPEEARSRVSQIAEAIALEVVEGKLAPGAVLTSVALAKRFATSRTPVREAMLILEKHGLVEVPPRRRPRIARFDLEEMSHIYAVQIQLLGMVFELCARNADEVDLGRLRDSLINMDRACAEDDVAAFFWANIAFHDTAAATAGNPVLKSILDPLRLRTLRLRRITLSQPGRLARSFAEHARLVDACERGESELAGVLIRTLTASALAILVDLHGKDQTPLSLS